MANISITVGPITVTRYASDANAQEVFEAVYAHLVDRVLESVEHTPKQKLERILDDTIRGWIRMAGEAERQAERTAYDHKMAEIAEAENSRSAEWTSTKPETKP